MGERRSAAASRAGRRWCSSARCCFRRSALGNLRFALAVAGVPGARARAARTRARSSASASRSIAHQPARVLSGGEQQRLALARAWMLEPEVLFLDEPTANLDPGATREIERDRPAIHDAGTKIVMITHNLGQAQRLGRRDRVRARRSRASSVPPADRFFRSPATAEAAAYLEGELPWHSTRRLILSLAVACAALVALPAPAQDKSIVVASTTSTEQSGLFGHILPVFTKKTGIGVKVVALGTGQALDVGRRGDADVVFVHDRAAEDKFVAEGVGVDRRDVMYNDFVLIGPKADPAKVAGAKDLAAALEADRRREGAVRLARRQERHARRRAALLQDGGVDPLEGKGSWYRETGSGMGPALNTASSMNAYILSDRGTWLSFKNRGDLAIVVEGDKRCSTSTA